MAEMMHIPVLGVVENYSYVECPNCGEKIYIYGESHIDDVAKELNIPVLGKMPMNREFAQAADAGKICFTDNLYLSAAKEVL